MIEPHAMNDPSGRVALVTGAARGIGRVISSLLAEASATVAAWISWSITVRSPASANWWN